MKRIASVLFFLLLVTTACSGISSEDTIATAVASTVEYQAIATAVRATERALETPTPDPEVLCAVIAEDSLDELGEIESRWSDALEVAASSSRLALSGPLADLQEIRRDTERLDLPDCLRLPRNSLVESMDGVIEAFILFLQDEPQSEIDRAFDQATSARRRYNTQIERILITQPLRATLEAELTPTPSN